MPLELPSLLQDKLAIVNESGQNRANLLNIQIPTSLQPPGVVRQRNFTIPRLKVVHLNIRSLRNTAHPCVYLYYFVSI